MVKNAEPENRLAVLKDLADGHSVAYVALVNQVPEAQVAAIVKGYAFAA